MNIPLQRDTKTVSGALNKNNQCVCNVVLPENQFPAQRLEDLENTAHSLNTSVLQEMDKLQDYENKLTALKEQLENLTQKVDQMKINTGEALPSNVSFEHLRVEVKEMEALVQALQSSINGSNSNVDNIYNEVQNISDTVNQLEAFDKNNVLATRREIDSLRKRLEDCKTNSSYMDAGQNKYGMCDHKGIARISKPTVVQLNWRGFEHRHGAWGKDSSMKTSMKNMYWVAPLEADGRLLDTFRIYATEEDLRVSRNPTEKKLSVLIKSTSRWNYTNSGQGSGIIVHNNSLYYNCYNSRDICRYNLETSKVTRKALTNAVYNNRFSYAGVPFQDIDFAADEKGMWVMYATEKNVGNIIIGKLNVSTLGVDRMWVTSQYKPGVTNAFMVCGVLYATRPVSTRKEEIFYMYDTKTGKEGKLSIMLDKVTETVESLNYNPNDKKLYMMSDGYQTVYDVSFKY
ncbi:olfactomedin-like [Microcaecilia unicolor]|uniref:Olfactomedin-like n=1 Tax=Microcaecilia unicolor TaxID=1415580 RepID=A0A6P7ZN36_9AMPH|nr:olfactomedin-like [Microcaecilia unicolor]